MDVCVDTPENPADLNDYYDDAVANGDIEVLDPDFSEKVDLAMTFYNDGKIKQACKKLSWLLDRCDGEFPPPDMIEEAVPGTMAEYIMNVMAELGCD